MAPTGIAAAEVDVRIGPVGGVRCIWSRQEDLQERRSAQDHLVYEIPPDVDVISPRHINFRRCKALKDEPLCKDHANLVVDSRMKEHMEPLACLRKRDQVDRREVTEQR